MSMALSASLPIERLPRLPVADVAAETTLVMPIVNAPAAKAPSAGGAHVVSGGIVFRLSLTVLANSVAFATVRSHPGLENGGAIMPGEG